MSQSVQKNVLTDGVVSFTKNLVDTYGEKQLYKTLGGLLGYEETPPTIQEFLDDDDYLGATVGPSLYPIWRQALERIYPNPFYSPYNEVICLSGRTEVDLLDGSSVCMKELAETHFDKKFWVLAFDKSSNSWTPSQANNPRMTRELAPLYRVTLDNDKWFEGTPDHEILDVNNKMKRIDQLSVGDSLKPYSKFRSKNGYDIIEASNYNHKITKIEFIGYEPVYCMTVDKYHNFPLSCGVISSNCTGKIYCAPHRSNFV